MNTKTVAYGTLSGLVLAGGITGMVSAQSVADATGLTEEQVIEIALMEIPGEVIEVELDREDGVQIYEVEILAEDGREMEIEIGADDGTILKVEAEGKDGCDRDRGRDDDDEPTEDA